VCVCVCVCVALAIQEHGCFPDTPVIYAALLKKFDEKTVKTKAMKFAMVVKERYAAVGNDAFSLEAPFNEYELLAQNIEFIQRFGMEQTDHPRDARHSN
jgi:hypothetical protein